MRSVVSVSTIYLKLLKLAVPKNVIILRSNVLLAHAYVTLADFLISCYEPLVFLLQKRSTFLLES